MLRHALVGERDEIDGVLLAWRRRDGALGLRRLLVRERDLAGGEVVGEALVPRGASGDADAALGYRLVQQQPAVRGALVRELGLCLVAVLLRLAFLGLGGFGLGALGGEFLNRLGAGLYCRHDLLVRGVFAKAENLDQLCFVHFWFFLSAHSGGCEMLLVLPCPAVKLETRHDC